jgi:hypothetical protein
LETVTEANIDDSLKFAEASRCASCSASLFPVT